MIRRSILENAKKDQVKMKMYILGGLICFLMTSGNIAVASEIIQDDAESHVQPMTIMASTDGRFGKSHSWRLNVSDSGEAVLVIDTWPKPVSKKFIVTQEQLKQFSDVLDAEQFFLLKDDEYGEVIVDGSIRTLTISRGHEQKSVKIYFLMNWVYTDPQKLREPARAVRIFNVVRSWINESQAVDLRLYDQVILDAVDKVETIEE